VREPVKLATAEDHHRKGRELLQSKQYRDAVEELTQAVAIKPDHALALNARGYAYLLLRDYQHAIEDFNRAIALNPKYGNAYRNRAVAKRSSGDTAGAAADQERVRELEK
jgi:tetratricopeptide (TPR) repeat protein